MTAEIAVDDAHLLDVLAKEPSLDMGKLSCAQSLALLNWITPRIHRIMAQRPDLISRDIGFVLLTALVHLGCNPKINRYQRELQYGQEGAPDTPFHWVNVAQTMYAFSLGAHTWFCRALSKAGEPDTLMPFEKEIDEREWEDHVAARADMTPEELGQIDWILARTSSPEHLVKKVSKWQGSELSSEKSSVHAPLHTIRFEMERADHFIDWLEPTRPIVIEFEHARLSLATVASQVAVSKGARL